MSCYSITQFLVAPFWGQLSDRFGRKPVILIGLFGSALAHFYFAFSHSFMDIFWSRVLAGFFACNVLTATAYIADKTPKQIRSKNLSLIGIAFGAGFTLGPIVGFLLIILGESIGPLPPYGANFAALGAGFLSLINASLALFFLKESLREVEPQEKKTSHLLTRRLFGGREIFSYIKKTSYLFSRPSFYTLGEFLKSPRLGLVLIMSFIIWFTLAQIEPILIIFLQDDFLWDKKKAYSSFIYIGLLMVFAQGFLVRRWIPKWGEVFVNRLGLCFMSLGLGLLALSAVLISSFGVLIALAVVFLGVTGFSIGYSLSNTSLNGALSLITTDKEQGRIFGVNQSLAALARVIGPVLGGGLYQSFSHKSPFLVAGFFSLLAFTIAVRYSKFPNTGKAQTIV